MSQIIENYITKYPEVEKFYTTNLIGNVKELGWGSERSQAKRLDLIASVIGRSNYYCKHLIADSVIDIGCGYGDLLDYIKPTRYLGIDIRPKAIEIARSKCHKHFNSNYKFQVSDVFSISDVFDVSVGCGIFCHKKTDWNAYVTSTIKKALEISNVFVCNFLINPVNEMASYSEEIEKIIFNEFNVSQTFQGYLPNDITLKITK